MKKYKQLALALIILIGATACHKKETTGDNRSTDIVLLFQQMPENWQLKATNGGIISMGKYEVSYMSKERMGFPISIIPRTGKRIRL